MRHAIAYGALIITVLVAVFAGHGPHRLPGDPEPAADRQWSDRMADLERSLGAAQRSNLDRFETLTASQQDVTAVLTQLRTQIEALAEQGTATRARGAGEAPAPVTADALGTEATGTVSGPPSEAQVGQLMNERFDGGDWDMNASELARSQATSVVEKLPGVNLADMVCNDKLCRATFIRLDGSAPDIGDIWGHPPFINDGFTLDRDDGSVVLYFAQPGEELDDVREQLIAGRH